MVFERIKVQQLILTIVFVGLMQGRILPLVFLSLAILALGGAGALGRTISKKPVFYLLIYLTYFCVNLALSGGLMSLVTIDFYRYDGKQLFTLAIFFFSVSYFLNHRVQAETLIKALLTAGIIILPMALLFGQSLDGFQTGFYTNHNAAGGMAGSVTLTAAIYILFGKKRLNILASLLALSCAVLGALLLIRTGSRAFLLGMLTPIVLIMVKRPMITRAKLLLLFAVFSLTFILANAMPGKERLSPEYLQQDANLLTRIHLWEKAVSFIRESWILGIGIGVFNDEQVALDTLCPGISFGRDSIRFYGENHAHNIVLHILAEEGITGFFLLCLIWLSILRRKYCTKTMLDLQDYNTTKTIARVQFTYIATASLFGNNLLTPSTSFLFYIFGGFYVAHSISPRRIVRQKVQVSFVDGKVW